MKVGAIRYRQRARDSLALVNGEPVRQGSVIQGAKVEQILKNRVRFRFKGELFELPGSKMDGN